MLERFMSLIPIIILACWIVFFIRWKRSGQYQHFRTSYPFGHVLMGIWVFVWVPMFLFMLSPVKPARIPIFIARLLGPFVFVLSVTSMVYGVTWVYREWIKHPRHNR